MKKKVVLFLLCCSLNSLYAQDAVLNRNGREIKVNSDASTNEKGIMKLTGDLGGTADSPTVPSLTTKLEGTGTINYVPKFTATKILGISQLFDDGINVGIGTITPLNKLVIKGGNSTPSALGATQTNATFRIDGDTNHALDMGTFSANPYGSYIQSHNKASTTTLPLSLNPSGGNVGIGTSAPSTKLDVISGTTEVARFTTSLATTSYAGIAIGNGSGAWAKIAAGEGRLQIRNFTTDVAVFHADLVTGNVGIGTTAPGSKLEVNGASTNSTAYNAGSATSIDFTKSNLAYTTASANVSGGFTLTGMKDGGTYTLAVQGATAGTASFTATGFTLKPANNGATTASKHTLYTFLVMGTNVYYYMVTGL